MHKALLSENDVSRLTGVPRKTLQYWRFAANSHAPKFIKLGTRVYYRWQDLGQWLDKRPSFGSAIEVKSKRG